MNIVEAKKRLKKIANGRYYSLTYEFGVFDDDHMTQTCSIYIDGYAYHSGCTWDDAILSLEQSISLHTKPGDIDIEDTEYLK